METDLKCTKVEKEMIRRINIIAENQKQLAKAIVKKEIIQITTFEELNANESKGVKK